MTLLFLSLKKFSIIKGDMRKFDLNKQFDLIIIGFNSFLHLLNEIKIGWR